MTHEFFSIGRDGAEALPGIQTVNGTGFNPSFLQKMFGYAPENPASTEPWFPFDRGIQVPTPGNWDNGVSKQWGLYYWVKNQILALNGTTDNWVDILTMADQQDLNDFSIHTGLYEVYGSDGKLYVCGMYPGVTSIHYIGAVKFDVENATWSDTGELNINSGRFTNCQYCIPWRGKLWLATQNKILSYDPVFDTIEYRAGPGFSSVEYSEKIFTMGQRFFVAGKRTNQLKVYEDIGGNWIEMADLGQITMNPDAMMDYAQTNTQVIFFFNSVETIGGTPMSGYRAVEITTVDPNIGGTLIVDEVTDPVLSGFANVFHSDLNSFPDVRFFTAADGSAFPLQFPQINVYMQEHATAGYNEPWQSFRWVDKVSPLGGLGPAFGGGHAYMSVKLGGGGRIFSADILPTTQRKIVVYKIEGADEVTEDGLLVSFWAFGDVGTGVVTIRVNFPVSPVGSLLRAQQGIIHSVVSGGILNGFVNQIDNVPIDKDGGGVHQFIWDRQTNFFTPWLAFGLTVILSD
jgi:hypothetical protein